MKKIFVALLIVLLGGLGLYYWNNDKEPAQEPVARFTDDLSGLTFEYPEGENGYVVLEQEGNSSEPELVKRLVIMQQADYQSVLGGEREGGEGPASIVVQIYQNSSNLTPREWIERYPGASNFPLITGKINEDDIAGQNAITYEADGLYASRNAVFASGSMIYHVNGQFMDRESDLYQTYNQILESLEVQE